VTQQMAQLLNAAGNAVACYQPPSIGRGGLCRTLESSRKIATRRAASGLAPHVGLAKTGLAVASKALAPPLCFWNALRNAAMPATQCHSHRQAQAPIAPGLFLDAVGSKVLRQSGLLQDGIRRVPRLDIVVDREADADRGVLPDFMITAPLADEAASGFLQQPL
jgi:hypothetical protein